MNDKELLDVWKSINTEGDLRVWRIPEMFHSDRFYQSVDSIEQAKFVLSVLQGFDHFIAPSIPAFQLNDLCGIEIYYKGKWVSYDK